MNKLIALIFVVTLSFNSAQAQFWNKVKETVKEQVSTDDASSLTENEVISGLKEALLIGVEKGVDQLSEPDGFFKNLEIKIPLPEEAQKVESTLRKLGQDKLVDNAIESINRAAEDAVKGAKDIFINAIKSMTVNDAMSILRGETNAATKFLERTTRAALAEKFEPTVEASLEKVGATKYWNTVFSNYNKVPFTKEVNPDLEKYATEKALDGLFHQIAKQEADIRKNPGARVTDILKKVFGN